MTAHLIARPLTFLSIPLELRQSVYRHLYAVRFDRRLRLCPDCADTGPRPLLPSQILATCHQVHDEVLAIQEDCIGPLKVDLDFCRLRTEHPKGEVKESLLAKYGKLVEEVSMDDFHCGDVRFTHICRYCTRMKKLTVHARHYEVEVEGYADHTEDWWLKSDEVRDWLWPVWKQQITDYWTGFEYLKLLQLLNGEKEEGRMYSVDFVAIFELPDCDNTLVSLLADVQCVHNMT